jgi:hypothetical protein
MQQWDNGEGVGWRVIGSFGSFEQAQRAVDDLARVRFPVRRVTIVARAVRRFDQRRDRSGYGWAAVHGALLGATTGAVVGLLVALLVLAEPLGGALTVAAWATLAGAVAGIAVGVGSEALRAPPGETWKALVHADRYDLVADDDVAERARYLLARLGHRDDTPDTGRRRADRRS